MTTQEVKEPKKALSGMLKRAEYTKVEGDFYVLEG